MTEFENRPPHADRLNLRNQPAVDAQYAVQVAVPDSSTHVAGWVRRSQEVREELDHTLDVRYGPTLAEYVDIFPSREPRSPIHVFFHGGYWTLPISARDQSFIAKSAVEQNWTAVIVNYALCPQVRIPEITRQCRAAVAWVYSHAEEFNGDRERVFVSGHSAGGHIVGRLLATQWEQDYGLPASTIAGGLPISGLFELEPIRWTWLQPRLQLTGDEVLVESPIWHLPLTRIPVTVALGGAETDEFLRQSSDYVDALRANGLSAGHVAVPKRHHFDILDELSAADGALWKELVALQR